jgi:hypothetical protein
MMLWRANEAGARSGAMRSSAQRPGRRSGYDAMTTNAERKVIKAKVGLLELAKQLGNVTQACKVMG